MIAQLTLCALSLVLAGTEGGPVTPDSQGVLAIERNVVAATNAERARHGLPPLALDHGLLRTAREHTIWMTRMQVLRHTNRPVAENIAMGQRSSQEVVQSWMNSPGHRANILNRAFGKIGVAAYQTANGTIFWCQQFGN